MSFAELLPDCQDSFGVQLAFVNTAWSDGQTQRISAKNSAKISTGSESPSPHAETSADRNKSSSGVTKSFVHQRPFGFGNDNRASRFILYKASKSKRKQETD